MLSLLNRSIYYLGWYKLRKEIDYLISAKVWLNSYRALGGTEGGQHEIELNSLLAPLTPEKSNNKTISKQIPPAKTEIKDDIFGMSWDELERRQGGKLSRK